MNSLSSSQCQCNNTCPGAVQPNITPEGQVQDGNNNCPSFTQNVQPSISAQTVHNRVRDAGLRACRPVVRQVLTRHHRQQRHLWAQTHHRWTRQDLQKCSLLTSHSFVSPVVMVGFAFIVKGMSVTPRPVLWSGIDLEVEGLSWSEAVCHSIIELSSLSMQAISTMCVTGKTSSSLMWYPTCRIILT